MKLHDHTARFAPKDIGGVDLSRDNRFLWFATQDTRTDVWLLMFRDF